MKLELSLESLPLEIWCHIFGFLGDGNDMLAMRTFCRELRDIVDETIKKKIKHVVERFGERCGGKHPKRSKKEGCARLMCLGDFRKQKPIMSRYPHPPPPVPVEAPLPKCKDCGLEIRQKSPLIFHIPFVEEELPFETFLRIMDVFTGKICVPGRYEKPFDLNEFKKRVEKVLVLKFGLRWAERNKKRLLDGCDWANKNKQLMAVLRK
ncbi:putative F-box containing protein [Tokyovirus A1]|uniref:putative F-box containing protein n=1 Tax=Tokyovirus A1 TaxID=1826170 RepID=UPI0007A98F60|nr:putative F-box containing protein [Tokyovirus A1]BAU80296.1 putative F-box containing protein [Tokyovirus A1]